MRTRGLKHPIPRLIHNADAVASHADAWIETVYLSPNQHREWSRPMRTRGLKRAVRLFLWPCARVASHADAWIETAKIDYFRKRQTVASHADAWIETAREWILGLPNDGSRPMRTRGLKLVSLVATSTMTASRPMRTRGLKQAVAAGKAPIEWSRPMRTRGLKPCWFWRHSNRSLVASHADAWIETSRPRWKA